MTIEKLSKLTFLLFGFLIFSGTTPWLAIEGKVVEVRDSKAKIEYSGKFAPSIGNKVSMGSKIGNDFVRVEGEWKIVEVNAQFAWASAKGTGAGMPGPGHLANIDTQNPQKRSDLDRPQMQENDGVHYIPFIPALNASVDKLLFYESDNSLLEHNQRVYKDRFPSSETRRINWELQLKHPQPDRRIDFTVTARYHRPDGSLLTEHHIETYIDPKWTGSQHASGWGWDEPGNWKVGEYTVEIYVKDQKVAHGLFIVD